VEDDIRRQIEKLQVKLNVFLSDQKEGNRIPQIKNNIFSS